jgi:hypothetical protein
MGACTTPGQFRSMRNTLGASSGLISVAGKKRWIANNGPLIGLPPPPRFGPSSRAFFSPAVVSWKHAGDT